MTAAEKFFGIVLVVGLAYLVFSLIFGELFGDFGFDGTDTGSDASVSASEWLDLKVIAAGLVGFGLTGYVTLQLSLPASIVAVFSVLGFMSVASVVLFGILRPIARQQYNTLVSRQSYLGKAARVVVPVTSTQIGQVEIIDDNGAKVRETAKTDAVLLPRGSEVLVFEVEADCVRVIENPNNPVNLQ